MPTLNRVCVFCGSSPGHRGAYVDAARGLGALLGERGLGLVYGGASVGTMGALADATLAAGGEVIGVMPQALVDKEVAHAGLTELRVVDSMHTRKATMADLADAFIALPGGFGTLEELFEVITWAQLGLHAKPIGLLDATGYFAALTRFIDHAVAEGFIAPAHRDLVLVSRDAVELLARLSAARPPRSPKWIDREES